MDSPDGQLMRSGYGEGMSPKSPPSTRTARKAKPGRASAPVDLPKKFPEQTPLTDDGIEAAKKEAASPMKSGSGEEDQQLESGIPQNDPERPRPRETEF
jgi:hypothetical protein